MINPFFFLWRRPFTLDFVFFFINHLTMCRVYREKRLRRGSKRRQGLSTSYPHPGGEVPISRPITQYPTAAQSWEFPFS